MPTNKEHRSGIENRAAAVDLNTSPVDSSFRAALHRKLSEFSLPVDLLKSLADDPLFQPVDAKTSQLIHQIQNVMWAEFRAHEVLELSPLGIAGLDQHITKSSALKIAHLASKPADVVADPTLQLMLEAYRWRKKHIAGAVSLAAFHRCLRLQKYADLKRKPIFEMFGTFDSAVGQSEEAGNTTLALLIEKYLNTLQTFAPEESFEVCISHLGIADRLLRNTAVQDSETEFDFAESAQVLTGRFHPAVQGRLPLEQVHSSEFTEYAESLTIGREALALQKLAKHFQPRKNVSYSFRLDRLQGIGHYSGKAFMILHHGMDLVDGGTVNWLEKLTSNAREKSVVSGFGTELFAQVLQKLAADKETRS